MQEDSETGAVRVRFTNDIRRQFSGSSRQFSSESVLSEGTQSASSCVGVAGHSSVALEGGRGSVPPYLDCFPGGVRSWSGSTKRGKDKPAASHGYSGIDNFTSVGVEL
ncbi:unnamed protein product [Polarella glacialis]|uniref:Uncharacterized protein n=1 Tax=Polarella glacialis TaxID=89957 RepID=A0A813IZ04_POLGL|nr:unnamed protein product [Polarella glacialis]CAE8659865.1 unnamed protein product [Polarella glacialis]